MFENRINTFYCVNEVGMLVNRLDFKEATETTLTFQIHFFNLNFRDNLYFQMAYGNKDGHSDFTERYQIEKSNNPDLAVEVEMIIPLERTEEIELILQLVDDASLNALDEKRCYLHVIKRGDSNEEA
ncbi:hypothetical protein [Enterococcus lactis]|uniref:hypothetical protein n=1 Tax=Enterococcus lactis TaxID=357441 RepID=UPI0012E180F9|nr:hypothetical protein [Enterococcus lactis]EGP4828628.1 hypothetical protein [Enterococcus faecium]EGP5038241.1 hypothetical protein [Enterococcus faecium]EGP5737548.1 hypothetical protein [Enterococcus faecium]EMF0310656.1 hypothetical protein [Enterococcus faecium]EMF0489199.1 hypothetical protein [Enterococcus faecium]